MGVAGTHVYLPGRQFPVYIPARDTVAALDIPAIANWKNVKQYPGHSIIRARSEPGHTSDIAPPVRNDATWRGLPVQGLPIAASMSGWIHKTADHLNRERRLADYKKSGVHIPDAKRESLLVCQRGRRGYYRNELGGFYTTYGNSAYA